MSKRKEVSPLLNPDEAHAFAQQVADILASTNPGLFVTTEVCTVRTGALHDKLRLVVRLILLVLGGLMIGFLGVIMRG